MKKSCWNCENRDFCVTQKAIEEFIKTAANSCLGIVGSEFNGGTLQELVADRCRKYKSRELSKEGGPLCTR